MEAKARMIAAPISTKQSIEICTFIRGKSASRALRILDGVVAKTQAVPYKRFTGGAGHKRGIGPGKYPVKAAGHFIKLIKSAVANAKAKDMDEKTLVISMIRANKASAPMRHGRQRARTAKRTHLDITLSEKEQAKPKKTMVSSSQNVATPAKQKEMPSPHVVKEKEASKPATKTQSTQKKTIKMEDTK